MKKLLIIAIVSAGMLMQAGCGSARRGEPISGPLQLSTPALARGDMVFMRHCNQCHPRGEAGVGPSLNEKPLPGFLMKFQVRNGLGAMPSFTKNHINDAELDDLITFIKALRRHK